MALRLCLVVSLAVVLSLRWGVRRAEGQLSFSYYSSTCPNVERTVRRILSASLLRDPTAPAALTRLVFHDCQVNGCDASVLLDSADGNTSELEAEGNLGIRRLDFIDSIKKALERDCPNTVSCADIIALAGRDAIALTGGPSVAIPLGRRDGFTGSSTQAQQDLPPATISVDGALSLFAAMGMSTDETIAIMGAHTIGIAHCTNFVERLYPSQDPNLGAVFGATLRARCPRRFSNNAFVNLDLTITTFDSQYFRDILNGRGVLSIDSQLGMDPRTAPIVANFANNRNLFFQVFRSAFIKLTSYQVLTGMQGEIRGNCRRANGS